MEGAIAQLGERVLCKHEVVGSIPSGSTRRDLSGALLSEAVSSRPCCLRCEVVSSGILEVCALP
jgi:hypothetical protein